MHPHIYSLSLGCSVTRSFCDKTILHCISIHCSKINKFKYTIHVYSGITSGRVLDGALLYTKILEVNLFAFAYRLFHRDFSPLDGTFCNLNIRIYGPDIHMTSADCTIYIPGFGTVCYSIISSGKNSALAYFAAPIANHYNLAFSFHQVLSTGMVCPALLHMTSNRNQTPDHLILGPMPYPLGHTLPYMALPLLRC